MQEVSLNSQIKSLEKGIQEAYSSPENLTARDMIELQTLTDKWSLMVNIESTVAKKTHETLSRVLERV